MKTIQPPMNDTQIIKHPDGTTELILNFDFEGGLDQDTNKWHWRSLINRFFQRKKRTSYLHD